MATINITALLSNQEKADSDYQMKSIERAGGGQVMTSPKESEPERALKSPGFRSTAGFEVCVSYT